MTPWQKAHQREPGHYWALTPNGGKIVVEVVPLGMVFHGAHWLNSEDVARLEWGPRVLPPGEEVK